MFMVWSKFANHDMELYEYSSVEFVKANDDFKYDGIVFHVSNEDDSAIFCRM